MRPIKSKNIVIIAILAGLVLTQACGGPKDSGTTSGGGDTGGVTITNEVSSPAEMNVGDIMMAQFGSSTSAEFDFEGVEASSQYLLVVGSLDTAFGSHSASIQSSLSDIEVKAFGKEVRGEEDWDSWTVEDAFQQRLYDVGVAMALDPDAEIAGGDSEGSLSAKAAVSSKAIRVGETEEFRVLNSLTSMSSYTTVTARARCIGENVILYVDTEVEDRNPDDMKDEDVTRLCAIYDEHTSLERSWFGNESDVNGDGKVAALLTPQVNKLGALGGGIITGFFLAADLFARNSSAAIPNISGENELTLKAEVARAESNPISNQREIIYALVPDTNGIYSIVIPKTFAIENFLTGLYAHELQHVISYNRVIRDGASPESSDINEGLSHLAEDLVGFGQENYSRVNIFLNNPTSYQLIASGSPNLGERGASYLFMRFLYEQSPDPSSFLWDLYHSGKTGVANIETAFNGTDVAFDQFGEFYMRWMTALAMTNQGLSSDPRYVYQPRTFNSETNRWQGVCLVCDADDGRGTVLNGPSLDAYSGSESLTLFSSTAQFYDISSPPDTINFNTANGSTFGVVLLRKE